MASSQTSLGDLDGALLERILSSVHDAVPRLQRAAHSVQLVNQSFHVAWHRLSWKQLSITRTAVTALLKAEGGQHRAAAWRALRRRALCASSVWLRASAEGATVDSLLLRILQHINSPSLTELDMLVSDSSEHLFTAVACGSLHQLIIRFCGSAATCTIAGSSIAKLCCGNSSLRNLSLSAPGFSGAMPRSLSKLSKLTRLELSGGGSLGRTPAALSRLTALASLTIGRVSLTLPPVVLPAWTGLSRLSLRPASTGVCSGSLLAQLPMLPSLLELEFAHPAEEAAVPVAVFASSATELSLCFDYNKEIVLPALESSLPLQKLTLSSGTLAVLPPSWCLHLTGNHPPSHLLAWGDQLRLPPDADLYRLAEMSIDYCELTDVPACLATATRLTSLSLRDYSHLNLSSRGAAVLAGLSSLRELNLGGDDSCDGYSDSDEDDPEPWLWRVEHVELLLEVMDTNPRLRIKVEG
eukprot:scaffold2.g7172.t1